MEISQGKVFPKPDAGVFLGTIIDVIEMPNQTVTYGGVQQVVNKVIVEWVLGKIDGSAALDPEGKPYRISQFYPAKIVVGKKESKLYTLLKQVLNGAPPLILSADQLSEVLIGRASQLFLVKADNLTDPLHPYINVAGVSPLSAGQVPPQAPAGFVRAKDRVKTQAGPQGQPVQTYVQPPAGAVAGSQVPPTPAPAPAPPPSNNVKF